MLKERLNRVNEILRKLIELTKEDIDNIKLARHDSLKSNLEEKNKLICEFNTSKRELDLALVELNNSSTKGLSHLLSDEDKQGLNILKANLEKLHASNREYAKLVLIVKDFIDGLVNKIFDNGTNNACVSIQSMFKMEV